MANLRFEAILKYGGDVERILPNIDNLRVRSVTRGSASTIDTITDSSEKLTINIEKESVFYISDGEVTQTGDQNPGEYFGGHIAKKVAADLDGRILAETEKASQVFDNGDLTTLSATGTPIQLTTTTVPQMVSRMPAKLQRGTKQVLANMAFVIDSYAAADIAQYLLGKQFDIVESVFRNGYAGNVSTAEVYVSENLTGQVTFTFAGTITSNGAPPSVIINGVTFKLVSAGTPTVAGDISCAVGATATEVGAAVALALNNPYDSVASKYFAVSAADAATVAGSSGLSASAAAGVVTIKAIGGGRLVVSEAVSGASFSSPFIHCYYGKKGAIDVVVQDLSPVDMRKTANMRGTNVFSSYLAGIKTYTDGTKKFLDVQILNE